MVKMVKITPIFGFRITNLKLQIISLLTTCCLLLTMVGIAHPTTVFAAETVSLSTLIDEVRRNNPEILAYQKRVKAKEHRANIEGVLDDPTLKVEIEDIPKD